MKEHQYEETIGGRVYHVEVVPVADRWRAQLRRGPGAPRAMMPFYGDSPDAAADRLFRWLSLAHDPAGASASVRYSPAP